MFYERRWIRYGNHDYIRASLKEMCISRRGILLIYEDLESVLGEALHMEASASCQYNFLAPNISRGFNAIRYPDRANHSFKNLLF